MPEPGIVGRLELNKDILTQFKVLLDMAIRVDSNASDSFLSNEPEILGTSSRETSNGASGRADCASAKSTIFKPG